MTRSNIKLINKMIIGTPIEEVSSKLEFEIKPIIGSYIMNYETVYNAFYNALSNFTSERDVRFTGKTNILKQPEFNNIDKVKEILNIIVKIVVFIYVKIVKKK